MLALMDRRMHTYCKQMRKNIYTVAVEVLVALVLNITVERPRFSLYVLISNPTLTTVVCRRLLGVIRAIQGQSDICSEDGPVLSGHEI